MLYRSLAALAAASLASAATPSGFQPGSTTDLIVEFRGLAAMNGATVAKDSTAMQPTIASKQPLTGTSYAVIMMDLDIPTNNPPETSTLLHWMQTGLTPSTASTMLNTTMGVNQVFLLQNTSNTAPAASYLGPSPPAKVPLSHRYTQLLVDTSSVSPQAMTTLQQAAANRQGFNAMTVLMSAGLQDKVVAGNFFNVTNGGPATSGNTTSTSPELGSGSGTAGTASATTPLPESGTTTAPSGTFTGAASVVRAWSAPAFVAVTALFLGL